MHTRHMKLDEMEMGNTLLSLQVPLLAYSLVTGNILLFFLESGSPPCRNSFHHSRMFDYFTHLHSVVKKK